MKTDTSSAARAVHVTLGRIGPARVFIPSIVCAGTAVVMLSSLPPVALFGMLTVLTLYVALIGDVFVLPALTARRGAILSITWRL